MPFVFVMSMNRSKGRQAGLIQDFQASGQTTWKRNSQLIVQMEDDNENDSIHSAGLLRSCAADGG